MFDLPMQKILRIKLRGTDPKFSRLPIARGGQSK